MSFNWAKRWNPGSWSGWKNIASDVFPVISLANTGKVWGWDVRDSFGRGKKNPANPADAANEKLGGIAGMEHGIYDPYINQGNDAYGQLNNVYGQMNQDPAAYLSNMMKSYQPSEGFNFQKDQALKAAGNDAAAGGRRGSTVDIQNQGNLTDTLMSQDMQQWLRNTMGAQGAGMQGMQGLYDTGYKASQGLGNDLSNIAGTQAQLAYQGQAQNAQSQKDMLSNLLGLIGTIWGGVEGGPGGAAAGGAIGKGAGNMINS